MGRGRVCGTADTRGFPLVGFLAACAACRFGIFLQIAGSFPGRPLKPSVSTFLFSMSFSEDGANIFKNFRAIGASSNGAPAEHLCFRPASRADSSARCTTAHEETLFLFS